MVVRIGLRLQILTEGRRFHTFQEKVTFQRQALDVLEYELFVLGRCLLIVTCAPGVELARPFENLSLKLTLIRFQVLCFSSSFLFSIHDFALTMLQCTV